MSDDNDLFAFVVRIVNLPVKRWVTVDKAGTRELAHDEIRYYLTAAQDEEDALLRAARWLDKSFEAALARAGGMQPRLGDVTSWPPPEGWYECKHVAAGN